MNDIAMKVPVREKVGYSLGDLASNLFFQTVMGFQLFFYTDVFGLSAAAVGTMFLLTRFWDAANDPIMGLIADRTESRWGKFRPYLFVFAVPFGIMWVITFTTPDLDPASKLVYAYVTYTLMWMVYTAVNVPYASLMGIITPDSMERTEIASYRFVAVYVGGFIVQGSLLYIVQLAGAGNETRGWQMAAAVYGAVAAILFIATFAATKERVRPPKAQKTPLRQDLGDLFANKPWLLIAGATVFQLVFIVTRTNAIIYYIRYYAGEQTLFGHTLSMETLVSSFLMVGTVATIIGVVSAKLFAKLWGKGRAYVIFLAVGGFSSALVMLLGPEQVALLYLLQIITQFCLGPVSVLQWTIYTDAADFGEWKFGRRATGLIMAASLFALKLGGAVGGAIGGWVLAYHGYVANAAQTPDSLMGIRLMMSIYPALFAAAGCALMWLYPLSNTRMSEIERDLAARRGAAVAQ